MADATIGERIKKLRELNGMTQSQLSSKLNITHQSISKWERDESIPDTLMIIELSKVFSVSTDYLLLGKVKKIKKLESIEELSYEELIGLYSSELVKDLTAENLNILQSLGFVSTENNPEWTKEGKQLSDKYWYNCCEAIFEELKENSDIDNVYLNVSKKIDIPKELFYQFIDDMSANGKLPKVSHLLK